LPCRRHGYTHKTAHQHCRRHEQTHEETRHHGSHHGQGTLTVRGAQGAARCGDPQWRGRCQPHLGKARRVEGVEDAQREPRARKRLPERRGVAARGHLPAGAGALGAGEPHARSAQGAH